MGRTKAYHHCIRLIWVVWLCTLLTACGGSGGGTGQGSDPGAPQPSTPSACLYENPTGPVLYVSTSGTDDPGTDGSAAAPYATITYALDRAQDGTVILVGPGTYYGRVRIRGSFANGVTVRSQEMYKARLRNDDTVITAYSHASGCQGITIEGFDIAHDGPGAGALVFHIDADGTGAVSNITVRNNILHDSYNNDILKINNGISHVVVERNLFYNQQGSDEHIDINSAENIIVQDNIFMNDFAGSGRTNGNDTSSYVVVKDSNGSADRFVGSRNIMIRRNIFLNWEGSTGSNFVLLGEDGQDFYEAENVTIENNLMLGNSANVMRAPFGVKGGRNITFGNNTIAGDLPALAFAMRFNLEGSNPVNTDIGMYNNIWSDPFGTMGANSGGANDFSDTPFGQVLEYTLNSNLYWNGANPIPEDAGETVNPSDDANAVISDPDLGGQAGLILPRWDQADEIFEDGSVTICDAFERLVQQYGIPGSNSTVDQADAAHAPGDDILGSARDSNPDIGAVEIQ